MCSANSRLMLDNVLLFLEDPLTFRVYTPYAVFLAFTCAFFQEVGRNIWMLKFFLSGIVLFML